MANDVQIRIVTRGIKDVQNGLGRLGSSFSRLRKSVFSLKGAFVAAGIGVALKKLVSESTRFEDALLDLQKVMSDADGSAKQYTSTVNELADRFGKSAAEILQGAASFKQAGFTVKEAFELQKIALETATVSQLSVAESSALLVRALKGFKAPASEVGRLTDIMNEVTNRYASNLKQLAIGMADVSPVAKKMGFSFEETSAILTTMIEVFQSGPEAATAFNFGLIRLISSNKQVTETLHKLGVEQKEIVNGQEQMRKGSDIFFDVQKAFLNIAESEKLVFTQQLGGIRQTAKLSEIYDGLAKTTEITAVAYDSLGSRLKEVNIRLDAASTKWASTWQAFNNMARVIGDVLMPSLLEVGAEFKDFFRAMQQPAAIENFKTAMRGIRIVFSEIIDAIKTAWGLLTAFPVGVINFFQGLRDEVDKTTESMKGLNAALEPPEKTSWQEFIKFMMRAGQDLITEFKFIGKAIGNIFGLLVGDFVEGIKLLATEFNLLGKLMWNVMTFNFDGMKETYNNFVGSAEAFNQQLGANWKVAADNIKNDWNQMVSELQTLPGDGAAPQPSGKGTVPRAPATTTPRPTPEEVEVQGRQVVAAWKKALDDFDVVTDAEMEEAALNALKNFIEIEKSGQLTGERLASVWRDQVGPGLTGVFDLLGKETQDLVKTNNERFKELEDSASESLDRMAELTKEASREMKSHLADFIETGKFDFGSLVGFFKRKSAEMAADKIWNNITNVFKGGGATGTGVSSGGVAATHAVNQIQAAQTFSNEFGRVTKEMFATFKTDKEGMDENWERNMRWLTQTSGDTANKMNVNFENNFFKPAMHSFNSFGGFVQRIFADISDGMGGIGGMGGGGSGGGGGKGFGFNMETGMQIAQIAMMFIHKGGVAGKAPVKYVPRFHDGGLAPDEMEAVLKRKEYVLREDVTKDLGENRLNRINRGDYSDFKRSSGPNITVNPVFVIQSIDTQSGLEFLTKHENREAIESIFQSALMGNAGIRDTLEQTRK